MSAPARPRVAVVGHIEWITHGTGVMPRPGEIRYLGDPFEEPAGGGGVSAAQAAKLNAETLFYTALGDDEAGRASAQRLEGVGVTMLASVHAGVQTRGVSAVDSTGDRAILIIGRPTSARIDDPLPWEELARCDAAFFTGHDSATVAAARRARRLVVTSRRLTQLIESGVRADVLIASANDPTEAVDPDQLPVAPGVIVWTEGASGGRYAAADGRAGRWDPAPLPGPPVDSYGAGDSFAAGLTVGLARGLDLEGALALGARCGAHCLTGRGALTAQLDERPAPAGP
jgi:ribokinase